MEYHQRTLEMVGQRDVRLDPRRRMLARRHAEKCGVQLPLSLEEWFLIPSASEIWKWYQSDDWPSQPEEIGIQNIIEGVAAIPFHLQKHAGFRDSLVFMGENQGCALWAVYLDGNQDPLVVVTNEIDWSDVEHPRTKWWLPCAKSFSEFGYCRLLLPPFACTGVSLYRPGRLLWREDFEFLRDRFVEHPFTVSPSKTKEYRFVLKGEETIRLQITDSTTNLGTEWELCAPNPARLHELTTMLQDYLVQP